MGEETEMGVLSSEPRIWLVVSIVSALFMAVMIRLKAWQRGESANAPSHVRVIVVSFFGFLAMFLSVELADRVSRALALVLVASFWLAVVYDSRSLLSPAFFRLWCATLAGFLALWLCYELLRLFGVDLAA